MTQTWAQKGFCSPSLAERHLISPNVITTFPTSWPLLTCSLKPDMPSYVPRSTILNLFASWFLIPGEQVLKQLLSHLLKATPSMKASLIPIYPPGVLRAHCPQRHGQRKPYAWDPWKGPLLPSVAAKMCLLFPTPCEGGSGESKGLRAGGPPHRNALMRPQGSPQATSLGSTNKVPIAIPWPDRHGVSLISEPAQPTLWGKGSEWS